MCIGSQLVTSCAKPDYVAPNDKTNITDFYATLEGNGRGRLFGSTIKNDTVFVNVDYYYPIDSDNEVDLSKLILKASIPIDSRITPSIDGITDLTKPLHISVIAGDGQKQDYVVVANKKGNTAVSSATLTFTDNLGEQQTTSGIIIGNDINFSLVPGTVMNNATLTYVINRHATGSIANGGHVNLSSPQLFRVTAPGEAKEDYKLQIIQASKLAKGIRPGSAKVMFAKKLKADLGITADNMTGGIALSGSYLVLNTRNENSVYINALTGAKVGTLDLGALKGNLTNFYNTSDDAGNILVNNLTTATDRIFTISKFSSVNSAPSTFISWDAGGKLLGRKVSVIGDINTNAIITAGFHGANDKTFARWQVANGALVSQIPSIITITDYSWSNNNIDLIYTSPTSLTSNYFAIGYSDNRLARINGLSNSVSAALAKLNANFIGNAVDYIDFNNSSYVMYNHVNSFGWGSADQVFLIEPDGGFVGDPVAGSTPGLIWKAPANTYGPIAAGTAVNGNGTGDVLMRVSDNGFYLYVYFMFTNGYVVGVQFDCIDI